METITQDDNFVYPDDYYLGYNEDDEIERIAEMEQIKKAMCADNLTLEDAIKILEEKHDSNELPWGTHMEKMCDADLRNRKGKKAREARDLAGFYTVEMAEKFWGRSKLKGVN